MACHSYRATPAPEAERLPGRGTSLLSLITAWKSSGFVSSMFMDALDDECCMWWLLVVSIWLGLSSAVPGEFEWWE